MTVQLKPETETQLNHLSVTTGRSANELVEEALTGYLQELTDMQQVLDARYDDVKNGNTVPVEGQVAFDHIRQRSRERRAQ